MIMKFVRNALGAALFCPQLFEINCFVHIRSFRVFVVSLISTREVVMAPAFHHCVPGSNPGVTSSPGIQRFHITVQSITKDLPLKLQ